MPSPASERNEVTADDVQCSFVDAAACINTNGTRTGRAWAREVVRPGSRPH